MPMVLSITDTEILKLARLPLTGDAVAAADVADVRGYEQEAQEGRIEPTALATIALRPLLRRGVAKIIAAEVLEMRARDGSTTGFTGSGVTIGNPPEDFPRRLREDAEKELAPYLIRASGPVSAKEIAEVAKLDAEADKIGFEVGKVESEATKIKSDAVLAQLKAGVITADEARALLGQTGAAPLPASSTLTPQQLDARRRLVKDFLDRGLLTGNENGLSSWLGLPPDMVLGRQVVIPVLAPPYPSPASQELQQRLFGRSEGTRYGCRDNG